MGRAWLVAGAVVLALAAFACGGGGSSAKSVRVLVMDQNVLHGLLSNEDPAAGKFDGFPERIPIVAHNLASAQPDVAVLQEIKQPGDPSVGYPDPREVTLGALGASYQAVFGNFKGDPIGTEGLGQLTLTKLPILSTENHTVSAIRSVVRTTVQTDAGPLSIYNAHLEGTGAVLPTGEPLELVEIQNVIDFVNATRNGGPAVIAGDFNSTPSDPAIQRMLQAGFIDALAAGGDATCAKTGDPGCTSSAIPLANNPANNADHRIDFIFVLPGDTVSVTVKEASLWDNEPVDIGGGRTMRPSDHLGVRALLELRTNAKK